MVGYIQLTIFCAILLLVPRLIQCDLEVIRKAVTLSTTNPTVELGVLVDASSDNVAVMSTAGQPEQTTYDLGQTDVVTTGADAAGNTGNYIETVTVEESEPAEGDIRLEDGSPSYKGRVEIYHNSTWGFICQIYWTLIDYTAEVACRQLGLDTTIVRGFINRGNAPIHKIGGLYCSGSEHRLDACPAVDKSDCPNDEVLVVKCGPYVQGDVRLANGSTAEDGRVEIYYEEEWGTVCDDDWDNDDAAVICKQLRNYQHGAVAISGGAYAEGTGPIHLGNVQCEGIESKLEDCSNGGWRNNTCDHGRDAGVVCPPAFEGDVRLVGGSSPKEGRVEYYHDDQWGTVCNGLWDNDDAWVVCLQLGYKPLDGYGYKFGEAYYGQGSGPIHLNGVRCSGREVRLEYCRNSFFGTNNCDHSEDAGVRCFLADDGDVRLQDGPFINEGRVEIFYQGRWGSVCASNWSASEAWVVCQQLGYKPHTGIAISGETYGPGLGPIHLDNVGCVGQEYKLDECGKRINAVGNDSCGDNGYAAVHCTADLLEDGDVRLVNGSSPNEGRVEIYHSGTWGTVCEDGWSYPDTQVLCRQLGYQSWDARATYGAKYGQGSGPIYLDNVRCTGIEARLDNCSNNGWGFHNCAHNKDVGVICSESEPAEGDIRLEDGNSSSKGRVEIYHNSTWGFIYQIYWSYIDNTAEVACRQLGLDTTNVRGFVMNRGNGPLHPFGAVHGCRGSENRLDACLVFGELVSSAETVLAVECGPYIQGDVRLANGSTAEDGRVEIYYEGEWGTVCDDGWDNDDAAVICKQLRNYRHGAEAISGGAYAEGTGPIHLSNVQCEGIESKLEDCSSGGWRNNTCDHGRDAGVVCPPAFEGDIRLVGSRSLMEGRVEYYHEDQWGTVCDDLWDDHNAWVVCRQLGYKPLEGNIFVGAYFGRGSGPIHLDDVQCSGREVRLESCRSQIVDDHDCSHSEDVGVRCFLPDDGDVRLQNGSFINEGRVEIFYLGRWGSVCASNWSASEAWVVCQQLGYKPHTGFAISGATYGPGLGPIHLDNVGCVGQEYKLDDCGKSINAVGDDSCGDNGYAAVHCTADLEDGDVRLVNGNSPNEGRVEIYHAGTWGTICDDGWGSPDSQVLCRQLGYQTNNARATRGYNYGRANGPIHLDNVRCTGFEVRLDDCSSNGWGSHDCSHIEDVGVICTVPNEGDVRLADGPTTNQGRVEIYNNNQWGIICNRNSWGATEATAVCRQLGFYQNDSGSVLFGTADDWSGGPIDSTGVYCSGTESRLDECRSSNDGSDNCDPSDVAGARCISSLEGAVRLMAGSSPDEGRVEIFHDDQWGTVCDSGWDDNDARVVCRQLGYTGDVGVARTGRPYGAGSGPKYLTNVRCNLYDDRLEDCTHNGWGVTYSYCQRGYDDAGVQCFHPTTVLPSVILIDDIRLVNSSSEYEGRLEVHANGRWGTVCGNYGDYSVQNMAEVVCRQLGYPSEDAEALGGAFWGTGSGLIWLRSVYCTGDENNLDYCNHYTWLNGYCTSKDAVGVRCKEYPTTVLPSVIFIDDIRLVNSSSEYEGRLEVHANGRWGTVCGNFEEYSVQNMAEVVCRQLGYPSEDAEALGGAFWGTGSGLIWLRSVYCTGDENNLDYCVHFTWLNGFCTNKDAVGVRCKERTSSNSNRVVGTMAFVGLSLSLLTLSSLVAVWYTCTRAKTIRPMQRMDQGTPLTTVNARSTTVTDACPPNNEGTEVTSFSS